MTGASAQRRSAKAAESTGLLAKLHSIKLGGGSNDPAKVRVKRRELTQILADIAMLLENGLSLTRCLDTLAQERGFQKHAFMLNAIRRNVKSGSSFSSALAAFPKVFNHLMVNQVRIGERSGKVPETLRRLATRMEKQNEFRAKILKKLSYPALIVTAGTGLIIFMLTVIVPQFEEFFSDSSATLPFITRFVSGASAFIGKYGWIALVIVPAAAYLVRHLYKNPVTAYRMDRALLRLPLFGGWLRDLAIFQFMDALCVMLDSGFVPVDAVGAATAAVGNRAVKRTVEKVRTAMIRGERLSDELDRHSQIFPPTLSRLIIVGEEAGDLAKAVGGIRKRLMMQIENRLGAILGIMEPALTAGMAGAIGTIVLAIYMPMMNMSEAMNF